MVGFLIGAFLFGLLIGSFLNVCIYRIPLPDHSILRPRHSFCPHCHHQIPPYDNIPLLSYLLLRGRCRYCRTRIGGEYPLVELLTGLAALWIAWRYGWSLEGAALFTYVCLLITLSFIDLHHYLLPDELIICGFVIALTLAGIEILRHVRPLVSLLYGATGVVLGGGSLLLIAVLGEWLFRKEAMGGGDIKLMAMIGFYLALWPQRSGGFTDHLLLSVRQLLLVLLFGAFSGALAGMIVLITRAKGSEERIIPFGPFLAASSILVIQYGDTLWHWYMNMVG